MKWKTCFLNLGAFSAFQKLLLSSMNYTKTPNWLSCKWNQVTRYQKCTPWKIVTATLKLHSHQIQRRDGTLRGCAVVGVY